MKEITLYREDNGQYSTSEAKQDDLSGVYVQKEHLTDLQKENDELKQQLGVAASFPLKVRMECRKMISSKLLSLDSISMLHYSADKALSNTAEKSLAEIKKEAVHDAMKHCFDSPDFNTYCTRMMEYANQLKEG